RLAYEEKESSQVENGFETTLERSHDDSLTRLQQVCPPLESVDSIQAVGNWKHSSSPRPESGV
ncbi:MAG: hypothetical protein ACE5JX_23000, partial [Acidobacteriota bacterium]